MISGINLISIIKDKCVLKQNDNDYTLLFKKFNRRFPEEFVPQLLDSLNNSYINNFVKTMKKNHKEMYLENFYSNLSNSIIIKNKYLQNILLNKEEFGGNIFTKRNNLIILGNKEVLEKNNAVLTPYHELLHLLTTRFSNKFTLRVGLQYNEFAYGLNEGCTEYLTKKYFGESEEKDFCAYQHFCWFINMLEDIIGKGKLEYYYFNSNLEELIIELQKYISVDKVFNLIKDTDLLFDTENELFDYQKSYMFNGKKLDKEELKQLYDVNKELRDRIYNTFLKMNERKEKQTGIKTNFKEKNDEIKKQQDETEELYYDYFISKCDKNLKR